MSIIHSESGVIEIPFPETKVKAYLKKLNISSWENLTIEDKKKIFILAINDFKKGKVSLDELAEISGNMWSTLPADRSSDLADALYKCGELNFYVRIITKDNPGNFVWFMSEVMKYYNKHDGDQITIKIARGFP